MYRYDITDVLFQETFQHFSDDVVRASSKKNATKGYPITRIPNRKLGINVDGLGDPMSGVLQESC